MSAQPNPGSSITTDPTPDEPMSSPAADPRGTAPEDPRGDLAVLSSLQASTQFADTKVGILGGIQAGILATAIPRADSVHDAWARGGPIAWIAITLLMTQMSGFVAGVYCVAQALRPRLGPPPAPNRFSLPLLAAGDGMPPAGGGRCEQRELWQFAHVVAEVAMIKHRYVARAIACTGVMVVAGGSWFVVGPLLA